MSQRLRTPENTAKIARGLRMMQINEREKKRTRLVNVQSLLWFKAAGIDPVLLVICGDPTGIEMADFFLCTCQDAHPAEVFERYSNRWSFENTFRCVKQALYAQQPESLAKEAPERAMPIFLDPNRLVWKWCIICAHNRVKQRKRPWYQHKPHPSFLDALAALRREIWRERTMHNIDVHRSDRHTLDAQNIVAEVA